MATGGQATTKPEQQAACVFLLYTLATSATRDTCPEHALNTFKIFHKHTSTPGPRLGHAPDMSDICLDFGLYASLRHSLFYSYAESTSKTRSEHSLHTFDKTGEGLYVQDF